MTTKRSVVLWGPPASGKSTVGAGLATALSARFVDLDAVIERDTGASIAALFAREGEPGFRAIERATLARELAGETAVIAAGGGALLDATLRREVLKRCTVVGLDASAATLASRAGDGASRPLLAGAVPRALEALLESRKHAYAEAHARYNTDRLSAPQVVAEAAAMHARGAAVVPLGEGTYRVEFGPVGEARGVIGGMLKNPGHGSLITDRRVQRLWATDRALGAGLGRIELPSGEAAKDMRWIERVWKRCLEAGADRSWLLACVGGGAISDAGGFAASTLLRGLRYVTFPTTLLAMVDASVGGKTAVNLSAGKNLAGTFHHPSLVWIDSAFARTLSPRDWRSGMAEALKVGVVLDRRLLDLIEANASALREPPPREGDDPAQGVRDEVIRLAVQAKIDVVARDPRESGERAVLNFGHTLGHSLESASRYALRHGEAVAVGMCGALEVGVRVGVTEPALRDRVRALVEALGLPTRVKVRAALAERYLAKDKKRDGATLRFVLARAPGEWELRPVDAAVAGVALRGCVLP